jgi:flagellar biosynthesis/type III secretory pathway protein FliH
MSLAEQLILEGKREGVLEGKREGVLEGKREGIQEGILQGRLLALQEVLGLPPSSGEELSTMGLGRLQELIARLQAQLRSHS